MQKTATAARELGTTGLEITPVGFRASATGGGGRESGWGPQEDDSIEAIHRALGLGVKRIDIAAASGFGRSELVVGRPLGRLEQRADDARRKHGPRFTAAQLSRHLALVELVQTAAGRHEATPGAVAVASTLPDPAADAIVGFRRSDHVDPILEAVPLEAAQEGLDALEGG